MTVKGWPTQKKDQVNSSNQFATVQPLDQDKYGLDVHASSTVALVGTDAAETGSTESVINATSHAAVMGDLILFTAGADDGQQVRVLSVTANTITVTPLTAAPANGDGFRILRHRNALVDDNGKLEVNASVVAGPIAFSKDTVDTTVSVDTATPANSEPLPVKLYNSSGVVQGSAAVPLRVDPTGTTAQPITDNGGSITVDGTVAATQSGTWNVTNVSGTISLPTGAATEASLAKLTLAQGSTTSGQSGALIQGAVTIGGPTYSTGETQPLSLTTDGSLRIEVTNSGDIQFGLATAAKQPALGTAGTASADVITVQGIASGTPLIVTEAKAGTATCTNVSGSASSVSLLASASTRKQATFFNDSTAVLYLKLGTTASTTSYTVQIPAQGYYELPSGSQYTGAIDGIWSAANGAVRITELT
jgi:hypothetical protein